MVSNTMRWCGATIAVRMGDTLNIITNAKQALELPPPNKLMWRSVAATNRGFELETVNGRIELSIRTSTSAIFSNRVDNAGTVSKHNLVF